MAPPHDDVIVQTILSCPAQLLEEYKTYIELADYARSTPFYTREKWEEWINLRKFREFLRTLAGMEPSTGSAEARTEVTRNEDRVIIDVDALEVDEKPPLTPRKSPAGPSSSAQSSPLSASTNTAASSSSRDDSEEPYTTLVRRSTRMRKGRTPNYRTATRTPPSMTTVKPKAQQWGVMVGCRYYSSEEYKEKFPQEYKRRYSALRHR